jgi:alkylhydroperoxidase family enzyme
MAYLAFDDSGIAPVGTRGAATAAEPAPRPARLSALEWSVVAIARRDSLGSLRRPGRLSTALRTVFRQPNPKLADERLEALRRMAVLSWHHGYSVPTRELRAFFSAGFSADQYETLLASIGAAQLSRR